MDEVLYSVIDTNDGPEKVVAKDMTLDNATILLKALFNEYFGEQGLSYTKLVADRFHPFRVECESHLTLIFDVSLKSFLADISDCSDKIASGPQIMFSRPVEL